MDHESSNHTKFGEFRIHVTIHVRLTLNKITSNNKNSV